MIRGPRICREKCEPIIVFAGVLGPEPPVGKEPRTPPGIVIRQTVEAFIRQPRLDRRFPLNALLGRFELRVKWQLAAIEWMNEGVADAVECALQASNLRLWEGQAVGGSPRVVGMFEVFADLIFVSEACLTKGGVRALPMRFDV